MPCEFCVSSVKRVDSALEKISSVLGLGADGIQTRAGSMLRGTDQVLDNAGTL